MITGAHSIIYSVDAEADREFFRNVLLLPSVDVGDRWLIFALPPAELAVHPSEENDQHELYLVADDVEAFVAAMSARGIGCTPVANMGWGMLTSVTLPGGGKLGVYQPRHARPQMPGTAGAGKAAEAVRRAAKAAKKAVKKVVRSTRKALASVKRKAPVKKAPAKKAPAKKAQGKKAAKKAPAKKAAKKAKKSRA